jgi:tetratricopeptide (TPR) repeat protein
LLYQGQRQHQFAIDDFTTAIGLSLQEIDPFIARGLSYMAIGDFKAGASDLDDAVQLDPQNLRAWMSRGLAYERLGNKERAAGSYARALNINRDYEPAKVGFARVGGRMGQTYQTF